MLEQAQDPIFDAVVKATEEAVVNAVNIVTDKPFPPSSVAEPQGAL